jgi:very-short-patch-repair endonuclease
VVRVGSVLSFMTRAALRWQLSSGRWQCPCRGVVVAHSGDLNQTQQLWVALLAAGSGAVLGGLTAARLDKFKWSGRDEETPVYVVVPEKRHPKCKPPGLRMVVHYSIWLGDADVHPLLQPPRTRIARSVIDAAAWMPTDRGAQAILAAGVQQRLVRVCDLQAVVERNQRVNRRRLISETLEDIAGGAQALSELDFTRLIRAHKLPEPTLQYRRQDEKGRNRYLDAVWESQKVVVEIDGAQHMQADKYWEDMDRDNALQLEGYVVLRFPAWLVRYHPAEVAARIKAALKILCP